MRFTRPGKLRLERGLKITRGKRVVKEARAHPAAFFNLLSQIAHANSY